MPAVARLLLVLSYATPLGFSLLYPAPAGAAVTREEVERAIRDGVNFLKGQQQDDGSWPDADSEAHGRHHQPGDPGAVDARASRSTRPTIATALEFLRNFGPEQLKSTYAVALQTMVFAAADPDRDQVKIAANVRLARGCPDQARRTRQLARLVDLLRLQDPQRRQLEHPVRPARPERRQRGRRPGQARGLGPGPRATGSDTSTATAAGATRPTAPAATASMTCAGISSLIITGLKRFQGQEYLVGDQIQNCGKGGINANLQRGIDWMASHFDVGENFGIGQQWRYYYLYGLERAGRLTGQRFFGEHDWYREGAEKLVHDQDKLQGFWQGAGPVEGRSPSGWSRPASPLLFLAKGRAPVLINKLRHGPGGDWNNDHDDIRNLVGLVSRDWKNLLTWQVVDPSLATVEDLLQAPIVYFNGHEAPELRRRGQEGAPRLRRAGRLPLRRGLLRPEGVRPGLPGPDGTSSSPARSRAPPPGRGPRGLAGQAPAHPRHPPALGDRVRLPDRGDLLARRPLVLLEPDREQPGQPRRDQGRSRWARTWSTTPPAARCPPTSWPSATVKDFGQEDPKRGAFGSPSSATPATGTSRPWPSPT